MMSELSSQTVRSALQSVENREQLSEILSSILAARNTEAEQDLVGQIEDILRTPPDPLKSIDDQYIQNRCSRIFVTLVLLDQEAALADRILNSLARDGFLKIFQQSSNKKCSYDLDSLVKALKPKNEYDVQHLLFSFLRIVFDQCICEQTESDGYLAIRSDISVSPDLKIEVKYTGRSSCSESRLVEEVTADIQRFNGNNHFFFIYDVNKVIRNKYRFSENYSRSGNRIPEKNVRFYIFQP